MGGYKYVLQDNAVIQRGLLRTFRASRNKMTSFQSDDGGLLVLPVLHLTLVQVLVRAGRKVQTQIN